MGCGSSRAESVIYNATPFQIFLQILKDKKIINEFEKKSDFRAEVEGGYAGVGLKVGGGTESAEKGVMQYVDKDNSGFTKVSASSEYSQEVSPSATSYITIKVEYGRNEETNEPLFHEIQKNFEVKGTFKYILGLCDAYEEDGFSPEKHLKFEKACEESPWRVKNGTQNYFVFGVYTKCKGCDRRVGCLSSCPVYKKYKGHMADNAEEKKMNPKFTYTQNPTGDNNQVGAKSKWAPVMPKVSSLTCPNGHELKNVPKRCNTHFSCNSCSEKVRRGGTSCVICDFDLCFECAFPGQTLPKLQRKCPNGHDLKNYPKRIENGAYCSACEDDLDDGAESCPQCDYDLCTECME
jgi:hypothetical protein